MERSQKISQNISLYCYNVLLLRCIPEHRETASFAGSVTMDREKRMVKGDQGSLAKKSSCWLLK